VLYGAGGQGIRVSVVEAGDLLVFPNLWGHAVLTQVRSCLPHMPSPLMVFDDVGVTRRDPM
jgi:hypothetical protein